MKCRCGHGRSFHRATANAMAKNRRVRRGITAPELREWKARPAQAGCRYGAPSGARKVCPCRNFVEAVVA